MKKKQSILLCTCIVLGLTSIPQCTIFAQTNEAVADEVSISASPSTLKQPEVNTLTEITSYIKSKIDIPKTLTEFEYYYNSSSSLSTPKWHLTWQNEDYTERIYVTCDNNKHILNYYYSVDKEDKQNKPVYLKKELKETADEFIKRTIPDVYSHLEYKNTSNTNIYSGTYSYLYTRIENGIPMPDNTIEVCINYQTGEVVSLDCDWLYDIAIPAKDIKLTKEEAAKKIGSTLTMKLEYRHPFEDIKTNNPNQAYLIYYPEQSYLSVDAKTGKIYLSRKEWLEDNAEEEKSTARDSAAGGSKEDSGILTKEEIASIRKLNNLISQKSAIESIQNEKSLLLDENCTTINAVLTLIPDRNNEKNKKYVWDISFSDSRNPEKESKDKYKPYSRATIDAQNGRILSYYASTPEYYNTTEDKWSTINVKYNLNECLPIFETFAKKQIPEYFNNSKLINSGDDYIAAYKNDTPIYGGYNYFFTRLNESVPYTSNGFQGSVDGITGKIYSYHTNWDETITFQSTKGIMNASEAFDQYIAKDGYGLVYEINSIHNPKDGSQRNEVRLVYRGDITPSFISPFSGEQLDYMGNVWTGENTSYTYTDLESSNYKRSILLLADLGIGFDGGKYHPSYQMTKGDFESMISSLRYSSNSLTTKERSQKITRTEAVRRLITYAELDKVAKMKNIYKTDFKDEKKIASSDLGYVALAKGLGIVSGDNFRGGEILTREEAADMVINLLKADY